MLCKTSWLRDNVANLRPASIAVLMGAAAFASDSADAQTPQNQPPNILVIMADDIGYWNVSAYNRGLMGYRTPNIDRIAKEDAISPTSTANRAAPPGG